MVSLWELDYLVNLIQHEQSSRLHGTPVACGSPLRPVFWRSIGVLLGEPPVGWSGRGTRMSAVKDVGLVAGRFSQLPARELSFSPARNALPGLLTPAGNWAPQMPTPMQ